MGCKVCANLCKAAENTKADAGRKSRLAAFCTKFGRFEVRSVSAMQSSTFRLHAASRVHRRALKLWTTPDLPVFELLPDDGPQYDLQCQLLRGPVPQIADYLFVWRCLKSCVSFTGVSTVTHTLSFLDMPTSRTQRDEIHRKAVRNIAMTMVEALREQTRQILCQAEAWTLSFDDRGSWRLFNFDASLVESGPEDGSSAEKSVVRKHGMLAVEHLGQLPESVLDLDEDYIVKVAKSVQKALEVLFRPEPDLLPSVTKKLRAVMGDGCPPLQKGLRYLQAVYPSIVFVGRDPAHIVRKSCQEAWVREMKFEAYWEKIWKTKHSLIPTIQNSPVWLTELRCAQKLVMSRDHEQGGGLKRIMQHFSFAKQRYESSAHPQLVYVLLMTAVSLVLAAKASDRNQDKEVRDKAAALLKQMTPSHAAIAGLSADYGCECAALVRMFDVSSRDPATYRRLVIDWCDKMQVLFLQGRILEEPSGARVATHEAATATFTAVKMFMESPPLIYDGKVHYFWHSKAKEEILDALDSAQIVTKACLDRLRAEFTNNLISDLSVFDLYPWSAAKQGHVNDYESFCENRRKQIFRLCQALEVRASRQFKQSCWRQFFGIVDRLALEVKDEVAAEPYLDCRQIWGTAIVQRGQELVGEACSELAALYHLYNSLSSGTSNVERSLGKLAKQLEVHSGPACEDTIAGLALIANAPLDEASWAAKPTSTVEFGDTCKAKQIKLSGFNFSWDQDLEFMYRLGHRGLGPMIFHRDKPNIA